VDSTWTILSSGIDRTFNVHVPASYAPQIETALVLNFHGFTSNAQQEDLLAAMSQKADKEGFIAVHPQGLGSPASWNAGKCCGQFAGNDLDDVQFVNDLLDELEARLCVDEKRIFSTGMSNGGFFSHRLGCDLAGRIAAVAPVAGVLGVDTCAPKRPMPVMHFHGTLDPLVPYDGSGAPTTFPSVSDTFKGWATRDGCQGDPAEVFHMNEVHCARYEQCQGGSHVELCTVEGGGHTWPGGLPIPVGFTTYAINATNAMWDFFTAHPMP
jgi:polyhydroxybutyrate depolymerase